MDGGTKCGHEWCVCSMSACVSVHGHVCLYREHDICVSLWLCAAVCFRMCVCLSVCVWGACRSLSAPASRVRARGKTLTTSVILLTKWWQKISHGALMTAGVCQQALSPPR